MCVAYYFLFPCINLALQRARIPRGIQLVIEKSLGLVEVTEKKRIKSESGKNKKDKESKKRRQSKEKRRKLNRSKNKNSSKNKDKSNEKMNLQQNL